MLPERTMEAWARFANRSGEGEKVQGSDPGISIKDGILDPVIETGDAELSIPRLSS